MRAAKEKMKYYDGNFQKIELYILGPGFIYLTRIHDIKVSTVNDLLISLHFHLYNLY